MRAKSVFELYVYTNSHVRITSLHYTFYCMPSILPEMQHYWPYIVGMLTNFSALPLDKMHSMLLMFAVPGEDSTGIPLSALKRLLDEKVAVGSVVLCAGQYSLPQDHWTTVLECAVIVTLDYTGNRRRYNVCMYMFIRMSLWWRFCEDGLVTFQQTQGEGQWFHCMEK